MNDILCKECGHSINEHARACRHHDTIEPANWDYCRCKQSAQDIAAAAIAEARREAVQDAINRVCPLCANGDHPMKTSAGYFHTEINGRPLEPWRSCDASSAIELLTEPATRDTERDEREKAVYRIALEREALDKAYKEDDEPATLGEAVAVTYGQADLSQVGKVIVSKEFAKRWTDNPQHYRDYYGADEVEIK